MRPLTDDETKLVFEKLNQFIGKNVRYLIEREDEPYWCVSLLALCD